MTTTKMFTQKHFRYFAKLLGETKTLEELQDKLVQKFKEDNELFDPERFQEAIIKAHLEVVEQ